MGETKLEPVLDVQRDERATTYVVGIRVFERVTDVSSSVRY